MTLQEAGTDLGTLFGDFIEVSPVQESTFTASPEEAGANFDTLLSDIINVYHVQETTLTSNKAPMNERFHSVLAIFAQQTNQPRIVI
jgi:hypothetical protein